MTEEEKAWIDQASYTDLLRKWRLAPAGNPYFSGETGQYFEERIGELRRLNPSSHTAASKQIGWEF